MLRHRMTTGRRARVSRSKAAAVVIALGFSLSVQEGIARTTPLGNATLGTSNNSGGANGVPSVSGPGVHPGYTMVSFRNAINQNWRFGGLDWLSDGRMVTVLWGQDVSYVTGQGHQSGGYYGDVGLPPNGGGPGSMHFITGTSGTGISSSNVQEAYTGLWEPLGIHVARSGNPSSDTIYVITKTGLLRFIGTGPYTNGVNPVKVVNTCHARECGADLVEPGVYRSFTAHPPVNYSNVEQTLGTGRRWHHFTSGLVRDVDGYFYVGTGTQFDNFNDRYDQGRDRCAVLQIDPVQGTQRVLAGGLRSPNGFVIGPEDEIFFSDIEGNYNSVNSINHFRPGRFFGMRCDTMNPLGHTVGIPESFPAVSLNQAGSANTDIANNPAELTYLRQGPYAGQLLYGDVTFGGIQRVFLEKVNHEWQGAVFLFSGGFRAGIGRLRVGPDGAIYAGSQSGGPSPASGNWCWGGAGGVGALNADRGNGGNCNFQYDFFKLVPKDTVVFDLLAVRARVNGFELQFTKKVGPSAGIAANYTLQTWVNNMGIRTYGTGRQQQSAGLTVSNVRIHPDSTRVFLELSSMPAASVAAGPPPASPPTANPGNGNVRVVMIKGTGILSADGSPPWGEPVTPGAEPSRIAAWYTLNHHSTDTAFTPIPVGIVPADPAAPAARARHLQVRREGAHLVLDMNFAGAAQVTLRDVRGRAVARATAASGATRLRMPAAGLPPGRYALEVRTGGETFSRPVALF